VEGHLRKLLVGENPLNTERLWDIMWRATLFYGRAGAVIHAMSGVDIALWDLAGKVWGVPVYKLIGGRTWERIPAYATGNDVEQSVRFGYKKIKLALPHGPGQGREGLKKNADLVRRTRELLGPDGQIMIDCWMALTEAYTIELAEIIAPYRVYWLEEVLQPDEYEGFARLNNQIKTTFLATGEHEYTRHGFRRLLVNNSVDIWQPDIAWCGGMTELRHIGSMALASGIPLIPHGGGINEAIHYLVTHWRKPPFPRLVDPITFTSSTKNSVRSRAGRKESTYSRQRRRDSDTTSKLSRPAEASAPSLMTMRKSSCFFCASPLCCCFSRSRPGLNQPVTARWPDNSGLLDRYRKPSMKLVAAVICVCTGRGPERRIELYPHNEQTQQFPRRLHFASWRPFLSHL
jgi:L-alanine-DL-glutamate epimerase-like enolase superfamily enzyme